MMNIIEFNRLKEEIDKPDYHETFDKETISALIAAAEHAEKQARKTLSNLLNSQTKTIDAYRAKIDLVVERLYDLKNATPDFDMNSFIFDLMADLYVNNISADNLDYNKIESISSEFQRKYNK